MTQSKTLAARIKREFEEICGPIENYAQNCHAASLALVKTGLLGEGGTTARVARGVLHGVPGQHSWAVIGDPYNPDLVVDVTAWSYDRMYPEVYVSLGKNAPHVPHGAARIWQWGVPDCGTGPNIELKVELSDHATEFIRMVAKKNHRTGLDRAGWCSIANAPVLGWPAKEILSAMAESGMGAYVPIDILGMLTDRNPDNLYW